MEKLRETERVVRLGGWKLGERDPLRERGDGANVYVGKWVQGR